ncbi:MAG: hypothetical protein U5K54_24440 [Cytophagales bacterium]|nr:hypothetical protein [Cytophagales bacterium]
MKKLLVHDFNGDSFKDVLIAGNDHTYDVSTGNYDSNKGLILLGTGSKEFTIMPPSQSGLLLNGQVESLIHLKSDTSSYVIGGINRRKLQVYKLQKK